MTLPGFSEVSGKNSTLLQIDDEQSYDALDNKKAKQSSSSRAIRVLSSRREDPRPAN
jgi:hypothetical protein